MDSHNQQHPEATDTATHLVASLAFLLTFAWVMMHPNDGWLYAVIAPAISILYAWRHPAAQGTSDQADPL